MKQKPPHKAPSQAKNYKPTCLSGFTALVEAAEDSSRLELVHDQTLTLAWDSRRTHTLIPGKTGSGKSTELMLPMMFDDIADLDRSVFVLDPQADQYRHIIEHTLRVRGPRARIIYFNPQDPDYSVRWNPFEGIRRRRDADDIADTMSASVPQGGDDSPYFRMQATRFLSALTRGINRSENAPTTGGKLLSLIDGGTEALSRYVQYTHQPEIETVLSNLKNGNRNDETSWSSLSNLLLAWNDEDVVETTSRTDFSFSTLDDEPCVFIYAIPEEAVERLRPITNAVVHRLFHFCMQRGRINGGALSRPFTAYIDEFASAVGRIPTFHQRANTLRKRGLALTIAVQTIEQIREVYRESANSLLAAFNHMILVPPVTWEDAVCASKLTGMMPVEDVITSDGHTPVNVIPSTRPVLTPQEIANPTRHEVLGPRITFLLANTPPFQGWLRPIFRDPRYADIFAMRLDGPPPLPKQTRSTIPTSNDKVVVDQRARSITDVGRWTADQIRERIEIVKEQIGWRSTSAEVRACWNRFESAYAAQLPVILRLAEELAMREASIEAFFEVWPNSGTNNIQANLHYFDYCRAKSQQE